MTRMTMKKMNISSSPHQHQRYQQQQRGGNLSSYALTVMITMAVAVVVVLSFSLLPSESSTSSSNVAAMIEDSGATMKKQPLVHGYTGYIPSGSAVTIQEGSVLDIPYYHCSGGNAGDSSMQDIVLLHGAAFTKEDWKTSGILEQFCMYQGIAVTALDLPVTAKHAQLQAVLEALNHHSDGSIVQSLPIAGLVTPSASGSTVVDWIVNGNAQTLKEQFVSRWIPVAAGSVLGYTASDFAAAISDWKILAIYGDQDASGRKSSELLQTAVGAVMVELPGRHPVYLDSPTAFVETVLWHLAQDKTA